MQIKALLRNDNILPVLLILLTGCFCMGFWGQFDFYIVNDHPMRIQYLWDALRVNLPLFHKLIYWNPFINCGEASLSLYPPGFVIFGAAIDLITFQKLSIEIVYKFLLILAYYLPGFTSFILLKKLGVNRFSALIGGLIVMCYSGVTIGGDVEGGMVIGLLNARLAVGLGPLVLYLAVCCIEDKFRLRYAVLTGLSLGLCLLTHPWDSFWPVFGLALLFILYKKIRLLLLVLTLALGVSAFWVLPAFMHQEFLRRAFIWDFSIGTVLDWIKQLGPFSLLYLIALAGILNEVAPLATASNSRYKKVLPLIFVPVLILMAIFCSYLFGIELFEPSRLRDNFFFSILVLSGIGIEWIGRWAKDSTHKKVFFIHPVILICLIIILLFPYITFPDKSSYTTKSIAYYSNFAKYYQMEDIFEALKGLPAGRILFTSSSRPMKGAYHTHIFALTPLFTGREIIGGVPTTHAPVANYLYYGGRQNKNTDFAEVFDNQSIFGMRYDRGVDANRLHELCKRLNITSIVVGKYEDKVHSFFQSHSEYFPLRAEIGNFHVFEVAGYKACLLDYDKNRIHLTVIKSKLDEINIRVLEAKQAGRIGVKISYYPLWKAHLGDTQLKLKLKLTRDEIGLIKINVPAGKDYLVKLSYKDGAAEQLGLIITLIALVSSLIILLFGMVRQKLKK